MINIEGDMLGAVKGSPPKGYIFPEDVLLGCDDNIGATVTAFAVLRYWISVGHYCLPHGI